MRGVNGACDLYSESPSGDGVQEADQIPVYPFVFRLHALCSAGSPDVSDVFFSTGHLYSAAGGTLVAVWLGWKGKSLVVVALAAILTVYVLEMI